MTHLNAFNFGKAAPKQQVARPSVKVAYTTSSRRSQAPRPPPEGAYEEKMAALEQDLLRKAATRLDRGVTTCLVCKGSGECTCPKCGGKGALGGQPTVSRPHMSLQGIMGRVASSLGIADARLSGSPDYLQTNRCAACRGEGFVMCSTCEGKGVRGPPQLVANYPIRAKAPEMRNV